MAFTVVQQRVDPRILSVNITSKSGRVFRWGPDEKGASNVPGGLTIATQIPGGFASASATLTRRPDLTWYDLDGFAPYTVYGEGGGLVAFDGYLSAAPMDRGSGYSINPQAVGWSSHMTDDASFSMVYVDRGLSTWTDPTTARQIAMVNGNDAFTGPQVAFDPAGTLPALVQAFADSWVSPIVPVAEAWYDAGAANLIAELYYNSITSSAAALLTGVAARLFLSSDDVFTLDEGTSSLATSSGTSGYFAPATAYRYAAAQFSASTNQGVQGTNYQQFWRNLTVYGDHGLTGQGPDPVGFFGADIIRDIISRAAPLLSTGGIVQDDFIVPHMAFKTPVTADAAVQQVNQYYLADYGAYEDREFFWRPPGTGNQWLLRVGDGVTLQDQGPQIETAYNGVVVQFTDPAGVTRFVGPPGYNADATDASLQDTSSTNPANAYGRKRWALVQMTSTSTTVGAIAVGKQFLAATTGRPTQGSAVVTGFARDSNGRDWPAWRIRAGDTAVFVDTNDQTPRYILSTAYSHDSLQNTLTLDAPPNRLDWIMVRLGLAISAID